MNGTTTFDPADTLSGTLPSLPPDHRAVLDPRFPIDLVEPAHLFWQLVSEWLDRETVVSQTIRATQDPGHEVRFIQPMPPPRDEPPVPYPALEQTRLDDDWDTATRTAVLAGSWPGRRRAPNGRFIAAGGDD